MVESEWAEVVSVLLTVKTMPKRPRHSYTADASTSESLPSLVDPPAKRTRVDSPAATASDVVPTKPAQPAAALSTSVPIPEPKKRKSIAGRLNRLAVPKPVSQAAKRTGSGSTKPDVNRRGNKINKGWGTGGFDAGVPLNGDEDLGETVTTKADPKGKGKATEANAGSDKPNKSEAKNVAELWVTRKTSYPSYLRAGLAAFIDRGWVSRTVSLTKTLTSSADITL